MAPINTVMPVELLEMFVWFAGGDHLFVCAMVCRQWRAIAAGLRRRKTHSALFQTPLRVAYASTVMFTWSKIATIANRNYRLTMDAIKTGATMDVVELTLTPGVKPPVGAYIAAATMGNIPAISRFGEPPCHQTVKLMLVEAIKHNHLPVVRLLYGMNAQIRAFEIQFRLAVNMHRIDIVEFMLEIGVSGARQQLGRLAAIYGLVDFLDLLHKNQYRFGIYDYVTALYHNQHAYIEELYARRLLS
jgi:hypothetical protein